MIDDILSQARSWGYICECDRLGNWQILPTGATERWQLSQVEDRWLLVLGGVPQVSLQLREAIAFLERRHHHNL